MLLTLCVDRARPRPSTQSFWVEPKFAVQLWKTRLPTPNLFGSIRSDVPTPSEPCRPASTSGTYKANTPCRLAPQILVRCLNLVSKGRTNLQHEDNNTPCASTAYDRTDPHHTIIDSADMPSKLTNHNMTYSCCPNIDGKGCSFQVHICQHHMPTKLLF